MKLQKAISALTHALRQVEALAPEAEDYRTAAAYLIAVMEHEVRIERLVKVLDELRQMRSQSALDFSRRPEVAAHSDAVASGGSVQMKLAESIELRRERTRKHSGLRETEHSPRPKTAAQFRAALDRHLNACHPDFRPHPGACSACNKILRALERAA